MGAQRSHDEAAVRGIRGAIAWALVGISVPTTAIGVLLWLAGVEPLGPVLYLVAPGVLAATVIVVAASGKDTSSRRAARSGPNVLLLPAAAGVAALATLALGLSIPAVQGWVRRAQTDSGTLLHGVDAVGAQLVIVALLPVASALCGIAVALLAAMAIAGVRALATPEQGATPQERGEGRGMALLFAGLPALLLGIVLLGFAGTGDPERWWSTVGWALDRLASAGLPRGDDLMLAIGLPLVVLGGLAAVGGVALAIAAGSGRPRRRRR